MPAKMWEEVECWGRIWLSDDVYNVNKKDKKQSPVAL